MTVTCKVILTASAGIAPRFRHYFGSASTSVIEVLDGVTPAGKNMSPVIPHVPDVHVAFRHHSSHDAKAHASTENSPDRALVETAKGSHSAASFHGYISASTSTVIVVILIADVAAESRQHNVQGQSQNIFLRNYTKTNVNPQNGANNQPLFMPIILGHNPPWTISPRAKSSYNTIPEKNSTSTLSGCSVSEIPSARKTGAPAHVAPFFRVLFLHPEVPRFGGQTC